MGSEIGDKGLLKRVADSLKIIDPRQMASRLKTDEVIPVIDLSRYIGTSPINPPAANQWTFGTYYSSSGNMFEAQTGSFDVLTGIPAGHIVRVLDFSFVLTSQTEGPIGIDPQFGWRLQYAADEGSVTVLVYERFDFLDGGETDLTVLRYSMHGSHILRNKPTDYAPCVPQAATWKGIIPPGKNPVIVWNLSAIPPEPLDASTCFMDVAITYVHGPAEWGFPPI